MSIGVAITFGGIERIVKGLCGTGGTCEGCASGSVIGNAADKELRAVRLVEKVATLYHLVLESVK